MQRAQQLSTQAWYKGNSNLTFILMGSKGKEPMRWVDLYFEQSNIGYQGVKTLKNNSRVSKRVTFYFIDEEIKASKITLMYFSVSSSCVIQVAFVLPPESTSLVVSSISGLSACSISATDRVTHLCACLHEMLKPAFFRWSIFCCVV